ncbi:DMT family transporter [Sphingomonas sinipercae]|uniref:DMT family transporter n=1 Tax=Sphingomonas sinipercae TaxID=2714944 RepID=A0A6G7ZKS1_9SPHN|nr:DMT family transporter [Sphingomonas sinipercae]QIL01510.1 DMT family transporter [Sphingomonas sinipercae]
MTDRRSNTVPFIALLVGSCSLAFGPWLVRLADVGPVAAGFWRLSLAIPFLVLLAYAFRQAPHWPRRALVWTIFGAALFYAADLALWNIGIRMTKLGNATLFGNISSFAFAAWGLWIARRWPTRLQAAALLLAAAGSALLMTGSYELSPRNFRGDLFALVAGLLYTGYLIGIERARGDLAALPLLLLATAFGAAMLLPTSLALGEQVWPRDWTPVLIFALSSQVIGQGLLVYAIGKLPPIVVGLALLTQPAISAFVGWLAYDETLSALDFTGAIAIGLALVLVRLPQRDLRQPAAQPS